MLFIAVNSGTVRCAGIFYPAHSGKFAGRMMKAADMNMKRIGPYVWIKDNAVYMEKMF